MATGKSDDQIIQLDNKFTIGLKVRIQFGTLCMRGDVARSRYPHQWRHDHWHWLPHRAHQHEHLSAPCPVFLVCQHIVTLRTLTVAQVVSLVFTCHPIHMRSWSERLSFDFALHFLPHAPPVALLPLLPAFEARRQLAAHSAQREYGLVWRDLPPHMEKVKQQVGLSWTSDICIRASWRGVDGIGNESSVTREVYGRERCDGADEHVFFQLHDD